MAEFAHPLPLPDRIETSIEELIESKAIGKKVRALRLKRSMGLVDLGKKTGLSASFLSQIETGRVVPTLKNLARICLVLGKDLTFFFRVKDSNFFRISRAKDRIRLARKHKDVPFLVSESLSALVPHLHMIPEVNDFLPGPTGSALEPQHFVGDECVFVLHGCLTAFIDGQDHVVEPQDVLWVDGNADRRYRCHGLEPTRVLLLAMPVISPEQRSLDRVAKRSGMESALPSGALGK